MLRSLMKSQVRDAIATGTSLAASDSVTLDACLMHLAGLSAYERVRVADTDTGESFEACLLAGHPGELHVSVVLADRVRPGDSLTITSYGIFSEQEMADHVPVVVNCGVHGNTGMAAGIGYSSQAEREEFIYNFEWVGDY